MPGLAGIIGTGASVDQTEVERMIGCMVHEPFYRRGTYHNGQMGICVGWTTHGGSFAEDMPLWNERRDVCLVFTGEDFMDVDEMRRLGGKPDERRERAGYLLALYEAMGLRFIETLNGWFSGLLIDLREKAAVLFNDRYGLGRIYYHGAPGRFYFASEAKSLLEVLPDLRRLDMRGVAETFACGSVLQDRSLFAGVSLLPGHSRWIFSSGRLAKQSYFNPQQWERQATLSAADFGDHFKQTFARILPKYLAGPERAAISLTGGLDGRMIMAWAGHTHQSLPCYTFCGPYRECADVKLARRIAAVCGQTHQTIGVGADFLSQFPNLAEKAVSISDGTMDVTGAVELFVNRLGRDIAPVRVTGNYGSEIVRRHVAFRPNKFTEDLLDPEFAEMVRAAASTYAAERPGHELSFIAFKQVPWHHYARLAIEQSQLTVRSPFLDNELVALMYRAPPELTSSAGPTFCLIDGGRPSLTRVPTDRGLLYRGSSIVDKIRTVLAEFTVRTEYAYDYGMPQPLVRLDRLLKSFHLERAFLGRHKFYHFRIWYRDQLASYLKEILLDGRARQRSYLRGRILQRAIEAHTEGRHNWTREIHRVLTLELLQRQLIERC